MPWELYVTILLFVVNFTIGFSRSKQQHIAHRLMTGLTIGVMASSLFLLIVGANNLGSTATQPF